ncbi:MAG: hypothetical protein DKT66_09570 [Candidatus Melainabacteria bacterium]|nr:MAG: hypothetical protein DKT66_09570 [Candidatus Melainabacteria bacterium]
MYSKKLPRITRSGFCKSAYLVNQQCLQGYACNSGGNLFDEYISTLHLQPLICDLFTGSGEDVLAHAAEHASGGSSLFNGNAFTLR